MQGHELIVEPKHYLAPRRATGKCELWLKVPSWGDEGYLNTNAQFSLGTAFLRGRYVLLDALNEQVGVAQGRQYMSGEFERAFPHFNLLRSIHENSRTT
mmetsp:Transcript_18598/g.44579  ORF Transcript_18598/g.44579 Transcript_18598/m.44579 type:complete len:99 (+) Transcript_18598:688-984(+)